MRPTLAAERTEPMPSTIVQKMTGEIIIRIRSTNAGAERLERLAGLRGDQADADAEGDRDDHGDVEPVGAVAAAGGGRGGRRRRGPAGGRGLLGLPAGRCAGDARHACSLVTPRPGVVVGSVGQRVHLVLGVTLACVV